MKTYTFAFMALFVGGTLFAAPVQQQKAPVDYVSPNIGGIGQLLTATIPYVQYPHGMARIAPITTPGIKDRYLADKIYGFPAGPAVLMASTGDAGTTAEAYASDYDHDFEVATPYYYEADLQTWGIKAELTASQEAAYYRFTFPANPQAHLVFNLRHGSEIAVIGNSTVEGSTDGRVHDESSDSTGEGAKEYFYAEFSRR